MQVGIQFFPDIGPEVKSARDYWQEALRLVALVDRLIEQHARRQSLGLAFLIVCLLAGGDGALARPFGVIQGL